MLGVVAVGLMGAVLVCGSCSSGTLAPGATSSSAAIQKNASPTTNEDFSQGVYVFPLDAYIQSMGESFVTGDAENILVKECMKGFGFDFKPVVDNRERLLQVDAQDRSRIYGVTDLTAAQKYGYHFPGETGRKRPSGGASTPAMQLVFNGTKAGLAQPLPDVATKSPGEYAGKAIPPGGCVGSARTVIYGKAIFLKPFTLGGDLSKIAFSDAQRDSRAVGYFKEWSDCMKDKGFNYSDPMAVESYDLDNPTISKKEIQDAVSAVKCKQSTNLLPRWHKVIVEYEKKAIEKNQLALDEQQEQRKAMQAKAAEVVSKSSS